MLIWLALFSPAPLHASRGRLVDAHVRAGVRHYYFGHGCAGKGIKWSACAAHLHRRWDRGGSALEAMTRCGPQAPWSQSQGDITAGPPTQAEHEPQS